MNIPNQAATLAGLTQAWTILQDQAHLRPIRNEDDFERVRTLADMLADTVGDDEAHPLFSLFEIAMALMEHWEIEHVSIPAVAPREVLRHLLDANNLKQKDLADIASPTLVSDILTGRREISGRLAKAFAERFHVDVSVFI